VNSKPVLTLEDAKRIAAAAEDEAHQNDWRVVIAVVDDGGHLLYLQRSHTTQFGSVETAIKSPPPSRSSAPPRLRKMPCWVGG
jgi:uncharacterized protein GlcG (DUF336 family)